MELERKKASLKLIKDLFGFMVNYARKIRQRRFKIFYFYYRNFLISCCFRENCIFIEANHNRTLKINVIQGLKMNYKVIPLP